MFVCVAVIIPEPPTSVSVSAINSTVLEVIWTPSNNTEYYQVAWDLDDVNVSVSETTYVISGLVPGTNYTICVTACTSLCSGCINITNNTCKASLFCLQHVVTV